MKTALLRSAHEGVRNSGTRWPFLKKSSVVGMAAALATPLFARAAEPTRPPNIVMILGDKNCNRGLLGIRKSNRPVSWPWFVAVILLSFFSASAQAQEANAAKEPTPAAAAQAQEAAAAALQKAAQNPVASMISVPIQNNDNTGINPGYRTQNVLNIQPVIPLKLNPSWNLIVRWIAPIIYQPLPVPSPAPQVGVSGLGDMQPTFFLSPSKPSKLIWGAGPILQLPTATSDYTGQGKLGLGPSVVALTMPGHFVVGALVNNIWSVAGSGSRTDVNQMLVQYFVNYNMKKQWYLTAQPIITANWNTTAASGSVWTVPFGGGVGRIIKLGNQPVNISVQAYGNIVHVPDASPWGVRATFALLFPKMSRKQQKMMLEMKLKQMDQEDQNPKQTKK